MGKFKEVKGKSKPLQHSKPKKQKSKRWKKGHSCASNPETTKFRQAAKERLFTVNVGMLLGSVETPHPAAPAYSIKLHPGLQYRRD